jgi:hypothetical protein
LAQVFEWELDPMVRGAPPFTPRQLLDAGRRAEAEGRLDLAQRFYRRLNEQFGHTAEAAEGRSGLLRIGAGGPQAQVWQVNGTAEEGQSPGRQRERRAGSAVGGQHYEKYTVGRALAALFSAAGWLAMAGAVLVMAAAAAAEVLRVSALQSLNLGLAVFPQAASALAAGALALLIGQAARAIFDQANAIRGLTPLEWERPSSDHS